MNALIRMLSIGMALIAGSLLLLVTGIMFVDVIGRYLFNSPLAFAVELVELCMGLVITFALALTTLRREHIRVDLLTQVVPPLARRALNLLADVATLIFMALIAWKMFEKAGQTMGDGIFTQILGLSVYPVVYLMSFAGAVTFAVAAWLLVRPDAGDGTGPDVIGD